MLATLSPSKPKSQASAKRKNTLARVVLEILALAFISIGLLEGLLYLCGLGEQECRMPDATLGWHYPAGKMVGYRREGYSRDCINSKGLRDIEHTIAKPEHVFRIALLGDSATAAMQVPMEATTARLLENALNAQAKEKHLKRRFEVLNFGCIGYSTAQELVQYETLVSKYAPDLVVLMYTSGDAGESVLPFTDRLNAPPRPYFYLDHQGNLQED